MPLSITVRITGDAAVMRKLRKLGDGINDMQGAMERIGREAVQYYETTGFTDRGRPWGNPWPPLKRQTMQYKEKKYGSARPLYNTGRMQQGFYAKAGRQQVIIDNHADYYKYHQSAAPRHRLPRRQMAGINNPIKRMIGDIIRDDLTRKING